MAHDIESQRLKKREYMRQYRIIHKEKWDASQAAWHAKPENREKNRKKVAKWRAADPERSRACAIRSYYKNWLTRKKLREERSESIKAQSHAWRLANLEKDAAKSRRRHARKRGAVGSHTLSEFVALCVKARWLCHYCGGKLNKKTATEDHAIPCVRGGSDGIKNILLACSSCNSQKRAMTVEEYREWLRGHGLKCSF